MTQTRAASRARLRMRWGGGLAFVATTVALVLLASLGTAVLVTFGSGGSIVAPPRVIAPVAAGPNLGLAPGAPPPVDRIIGSFHAPDVAAQGSGRPPSLGELLSPPHVNVLTPKPSPTQPVAPLSLPTAFPTALPAGPSPSPIAVPAPVTLPGPITIPLPAPLPDIVLLPGGLVSTSPSPLPLP